jgi:hypothetical protein
VTLLDLQKEYGEVPIEILWKEMKNTHINPVLIKATINLYGKKGAKIKR